MNQMNITTISLHKKYSFGQDLTACIGYFDGLHLGHQRLVEEVVKSAAQNQTLPALITFEPDPWVVLRGMHDPAHLTTMKDRQLIAEKAGIKEFIILDFTKEMADLTIDAFHDLLRGIQVRKLICGHDFHYGQFGKGNTETLLQQKDFEVFVVEPITYDGVRISSTRIEQLIQEGNVQKAASLLGRFYFLRGNVARGFRRGTTIHFPTANLCMRDHYLLPHAGVYAGIVQVREKYHIAMINVGNNPTFNNENITIEANIFDFDEMIYDEPVTFYFVDFVRKECRFDSREDLIWQLKTDKEHIQLLFEQHPHWKEESLCV